jgi:hypothetical protein
MKGQEKPSPKRHVKCPKCGLFFAPAGLAGHLRFYHNMGIGQKQRRKDPDDENMNLFMNLKRSQLLDLVRVRPDPTTGALLTPEAVNSALQLLLFEYIFERGIFAKK